MSVESFMIKLARAILQNVVREITAQRQSLIDDVTQPLNAIVQAVNSGVWRGNGADAFVQDLSSITIPGIGKIGDMIDKFTGDVNSAQEIIERADQQCEQMIRSQLYDAFDFYKG
ncbi:MAG: hypothetical protein EI684_17120 [Candidatus Viridilinea halotolerans]|uniref:WXG100 family type VII secretion target n=1 Tax=Candidatus Viridilinea halotolerans TaxID=2491704 RepID=A0A426TUD8_9CHLR|nr:MAG: hypothetical protein EI684_17120 [Candidatus Viridilinea halotolerans]